MSKETREDNLKKKVKGIKDGSIYDRPLQNQPMANWKPGKWDDTPHSNTDWYAGDIQKPKPVVFNDEPSHSVLIMKNIKGEVMPIREGDLMERIRFNGTEDSGAFEHSVVFDVELGIEYHFGIKGVFIGDSKIRESIPKLNKTDDPWGRRLVGVNTEETIKVKTLGFDELYNTLNNPQGYRTGSIITDSISELAKYKFLDPDQFDEIFTVETFRPDSPLLNKYLNYLAKLVNDEISVTGEIDNLEDLEKKAYDQVGYKGKDFDAVKREVLDYHDYFKFLITKEDKRVIAEKEFNYVKTVYDNAPEGLKKLIGGLKIAEINKEPVGGYSLSGNVVIPKNYSKEVPLMCFKYIGNVNRYTDLLADDYFTNKVAFESELVVSHFPEVKVPVSIILFDSNCNVVTLNIKPATITKWKSKLNISALVPMFERVVLENLSLPLTFHNEVSI